MNGSQLSGLPNPKDKTFALKFECLRLVAQTKASERHDADTLVNEARKLYDFCTGEVK